VDHKVRSNLPFLLAALLMAPEERDRIVRRDSSHSCSSLAYVSYSFSYVSYSYFFLSYSSFSFSFS
jgi:hypothetical protein